MQCVVILRPERTHAKYCQQSPRRYAHIDIKQMLIWFGNNRLRPTKIISTPSQLIQINYVIPNVPHQYIFHMMFMKIRMPCNDGAGKHIIKSDDSTQFCNTHVQLRNNMLLWRLIIWYLCLTAFSLSESMHIPKNLNRLPILWHWWTIHLNEC